jgi:hypothetical protein
MAPCGESNRFKRILVLLPDTDSIFREWEQVVIQ